MFLNKNEYLCTRILKMSAENGDPLAQSVEHHTFNVGVLGSNPKRITRDGFKPSLFSFLRHTPQGLPSGREHEKIKGSGINRLPYFIHYSTFTIILGLPSGLNVEERLAGALRLLDALALASSRSKATKSALLNFHLSPNAIFMQRL